MTQLAFNPIRYLCLNFAHSGQLSNFKHTASSSVYLYNKLCLSQSFKLVQSKLNYLWLKAKHNSIRFYSNGGDKKPPLLMNFIDSTTSPSIFYSLSNSFITHVLIKPYFDNDFTIKDFLEGAKQVSHSRTPHYHLNITLIYPSSCLTFQALVVISRLLSANRIKDLQNLVTKEVSIYQNVHH
jgi:hypothetical protein